MASQLENEIVDDSWIRVIWLYVFDAGDVQYLRAHELEIFSTFILLRVIILFIKIP